MCHFTQLGERKPIDDLCNHGVIRTDIEYRDIGVDTRDARDSGKRVAAVGDQFAFARLGQKLHHYEHPLCTYCKIHCAAHGGYSVRSSGMPVGEVAVHRDLESSKHADIDVAATDHGE